MDKLDEHLWSREDLRHLNDESTVIKRKKRYAEAYAAGLPMTRWPERYDTYDLAISGFCHTQPHLQDLLQSIPQLTDEWLQAHIMKNERMAESYEQWIVFPFLKLDLPYELAKTLALRLQEAGAWANYIPSIYREPQIPLSEALLMAEPIIMEQHKRVIPNEPLGPVKLVEWLWTPYWLLGTFSRALYEQNYLYAYIDKVDGHIWTRDEQQLYSREGKLD
ncbi:hypothetical protein [Dictyobacter kobayashii]|uniref:Uncharacterized protein n=1 Tax=Dictyobacter kobayashii TaxID=2014872 RepID=A0A402AVM7_9CHLR|nr:hypothetical protein [Dictyobacter kobayashii]GCE23182.1 hypothetical protein KDK_69820 [Dictyobacter kobayashii]